MKKIYSKPEIIANAYAEFENVMTFACSKMTDNPKFVCQAYPLLHPGDPDPLNPGETLSGQSDFHTTLS